MRRIYHSLEHMIENTTESEKTQIPTDIMTFRWKYFQKILDLVLCSERRELSHGCHEERERERERELHDCL